jgi:hypothetical protein
MKKILNTFKILGAITLLAWVTGCASTQDTENALVASGFKIITPITPAQVARLKALPAGQVTMTHHDGKTYYVFPDVKHNQAYVGGPKQLQAYQALRAEQKIAEENLEAAEMQRDAAWDAFGGWGAMVEPGFY